VLIVDDHAGFRRLARRLLEASGLTVVGDASDGASAVAAARALDPDLVLLDVVLPDSDGFAVAEQIAGLGACPGRSDLEPGAGRAALAARAHERVRVPVQG